jgi:hypothetical protein
MLSQDGVHDAADCSNNASVACRAHEPTSCCLDRAVRLRVDLYVRLAVVGACWYNHLGFHTVHYYTNGP